jgi:glutamyl/glutaminyl-tRNA synthetase
MTGAPHDAVPGGTNGRTAPIAGAAPIVGAAPAVPELAGAATAAGVHADVHGPVRPDPTRIPRGATTRLAPAPTGRLHLGHLVNAVYVWGITAATGGSVVLRIEDHDRQRSRPEHERDLLDDLDRLGLRPTRPSTDDLRAGPSRYRQSDDPGPYDAAIAMLRAAGRVYACECGRSTFAAWADAHGAAWSGPGCPGGCADRDLPDEPHRGLRVALGGGTEALDDVLLGAVTRPVAAAGDPLVRDRLGNRTYHLCVVVDDARHGVDLVIRGQDLLDATPLQLRLAAALGRPIPPAHLHHPLALRPDGSKLSKAAGDTAVGALLDAGARPADLLGLAASLVGLIEQPRPIDPAHLGDLFTD